MAYRQQAGRSFYQDSSPITGYYIDPIPTNTILRLKFTVLRTQKSVDGETTADTRTVSCPGGASPLKTGEWVALIDSGSNHQKLK
jgi:hypothetical protein